ncbi:MAG: imidazole glycerol phosphate synthase subunit HisH [Longimicrobiales bacterium]
MDVALFDYGTGNLHSLTKAIERAGHRVHIESEADRILKADALVLPGVGAFGAAAALLGPAASRIRAALDRGFPCLGICLGMQLLFDTSDEGGGTGLGAIPGKVRRLRARRVPHMGWNAVEPADSDPLFDRTREPVVYFANSYVAEPEDPETIIAWTTYGDDRFPAAVRRFRTWGVQFHPEKSDVAGLRILSNFLAQAAS